MVAARRVRRPRTALEGRVSRDDGFPIADIDVGILRDVKIRRLGRHVAAEEVAPTTLLYLAVVLSSWEEGYRLSVDEADAPQPATPEQVAALKATGLLDSEGKVPLQAWEGWFRPAWQRREKKRAGGAEGNRRRWNADKSPSDTDSDSDSDTDSDPESPSVPSVSPIRSVSPREIEKDFTAPEWGAFLEAWHARGFRYPPSGSEDQPRTQRSILWPIVSSFPTKSPEWCRSAPPGVKPYEVVQYVRGAWRREIEKAAVA